MPNNKSSTIQDIPLEHFQRKATMVTNFPDIVGYAMPGTADGDPAWQLRQETWNTTSGVLQDTAFAQFKGASTNDFVFAWVAVAQIQEIRPSTVLLEGNTATVDVDATTVSKLFATDHDSTMASWATDIAAEAGVTTAVVRGTGADAVIVVTAAVAGTAVVLDAEGVTGGVVQASIDIVETRANQVAPASLTFGA